MNTAPFFIVIGAIFLVLGIVKMSSNDRAPTPKANDHRAVKMSDGTYRVEYYWPYPGWLSMGVEYKSEADARGAIARMDTPTPRPTVTEVLK